MTPSRRQFSLSFLLTVTTIAAFVCGYLRTFGMPGVVLVLIVVVLPVLLIGLGIIYQRVLAMLVDVFLRPFVGP